VTDSILTFLDALHFATISTIDPDGAPRQAVVWYTVEGDEIVINSAVGRRWPANLVRDPRIAFAVTEASDGYRWVGINATVTVVTDQPTAQADIAGMARRYHADEPGEAERIIAERFTKQERISFRFRVDRVHDHRD
jgi:PPOX class probable F420-dependent enzyme